MRAWLVGFLLVGCGASTTRPSGPAGESPACRDERLAVGAAMEASRRDHACLVDADCVRVTGPGHPDPEYAEVVHVDDAATLDGLAHAHLDTCGAFYVHEAIDAYRVIEAACVEARCAARVTTYHVGE